MQEIKSLSQFNKLKASPLLIIDFYATWCGPCKAISPVFERLSTQHSSSSSTVFANCDVDKAKDVAQQCGITAMPTFQFFKAGKKVDEVKGADVQQLTTKIGFYTAAVAKEGAAAQGTKGKEEKAGAASESGSLRPLIDGAEAKLLGTSNLSSVRNIVSPPPAGYAIASATGGARCLIHLPFTHTVNATQLSITIVKNSISNAPSRINVGTNVPIRATKNSEGVVSDDLNMESINKAENTQAFNIYSDEYVNGKAELKLKASKFTGIRSLTIRIDANISGEAATVTKVGELDIIGSKA